MFWQKAMTNMYVLCNEWFIITHCKATLIKKTARLKNVFLDK